MQARKRKILANPLNASKISSSQCHRKMRSTKSGRVPCATFEIKKCRRRAPAPRGGQRPEEGRRRRPGDRESRRRATKRERGSGGTGQMEGRVRGRSRGESLQQHLRQVAAGPTDSPSCKKTGTADEERWMCPKQIALLKGRCRYDPCNKDF